MKTKKFSRCLFDLLLLHRNAAGTIFPRRRHRAFCSRSRTRSAGSSPRPENFSFSSPTTLSMPEHERRTLRLQPNALVLTQNAEEREATTTITEWLCRVNEDSELNFVALNDEQRTGHLRQLIRELVHRLREPRNLGTKQVSNGAVMHGKVRRSQGYSIPMIIEESRILQVSIFNTLQSNLKIVDFSLLLVDVMTIADECDSQLKQTIVSFSEAIGRLAA